MGPFRVPAIEECFMASKVRLPVDEQAVVGLTDTAASLFYRVAPSEVIARRLPMNC